MTERRQTTPIDRLADDFVQAYCILNPTMSTMLGLPGVDDKMPDYSPDAVADVAQLERDFLTAVQAETPQDDVDRVTQAAVVERHGLYLELHDAGEHLRDLNVISSPTQDLRDVLDLMPTQSVEHWENIAARMKAIPASLSSYREALSLGASREMIPAARQIGEVLQQIDAIADRDTSFFTALAANASLPDGELSPALRSELEEGAADARQGYADLGAFLTMELAPVAPEQEGVGRERYQRFSRYFLGAEIDLDETYEWGRGILAEIVAEQESVAAELYGAGTTPEEAIAKLNADPARQLHGTEALQKWMQETSDRAIADLNGTHFDIPEPVQRLECRIAPTQTGGIYYTPPTGDFSRPGRMWWSVPAGVETFGTWLEKTTVFHEGVPGHHLQLGQTVYREALLNTWRRMFSWVSGHGEGWALYAERLMEDLGYLSDPGDRMGMLDAQRLRAARVVLDIGVHLGKPLPAELGSGTWDRAAAWAFLQANASMDKKTLAFELNRYLGWPGQAPSYKVGQRLWEQIRDDSVAAAAARGEEFDLKAFHRRALDVGSVGLDTLRWALAE
ncbi:MAG: DUF885 domain-containing protein [Ruaniaceae bacterium]|nr:DUF885 domain-containing protein [Ruaniaceae bacterium]